MTRRKARKKRIEKRKFKIPHFEYSEDTLPKIQKELLDELREAVINAAAPFCTKRTSAGTFEYHTTTTPRSVITQAEINRCMNELLTKMIDCIDDPVKQELLKEYLLPEKE